MQTIPLSELSQITGGGALHRAGQAFGFGAGVAVTAGLALSSTWSEQVPGQPDGFQKRHEAVLGPRIARATEGMTGPLGELARGVADGATEAPGWSFRHGL